MHLKRSLIVAAAVAGLALAAVPPSAASADQYYWQVLTSGKTGAVPVLAYDGSSGYREVEFSGYTSSSSTSLTVDGLRALLDEDGLKAVGGHQNLSSIVGQTPAALLTCFEASRKQPLDKRVLDSLATLMKSLSSASVGSVDYSDGTFRYYLYFVSTSLATGDTADALLVAVSPVETTGGTGTIAPDDIVQMYMLLDEAHALPDGTYSALDFADC